MALRSPVDKKSPVKIKITVCTGPVVTSKPTHMALRSPDRQNEFCQDEDPHLPWSSSFCQVSQIALRTLIDSLSRSRSPSALVHLLKVHPHPHGSQEVCLQQGPIKIKIIICYGPEVKSSPFTRSSEGSDINCIGTNVSAKSVLGTNSFSNKLYFSEQILLWNRLLLVAT